MLRGIIYCCALVWLASELVTGAQEQNWLMLTLICVVGALLTSNQKYWLNNDHNTTRS